MPLIQASELENLIFDATIVMSVLKLESADGCGKVIIKNGDVKKIVEQKHMQLLNAKNHNNKCWNLSVCSKFLLENLQN